MSTAGAACCCCRLCGARGFSNDKSLMYWALTTRRCALSAPGRGGTCWPLLVVVCIACPADWSRAVPLTRIVRRRNAGPARPRGSFACREGAQCLCNYGNEALAGRARPGPRQDTMGDLPHYFDIILFAMVALFLVLRLRSVLGRRTGNERRRDLFARNPLPNGEQGGPNKAGPNKIVSLAPRRNPAPLVADGPPANTVAGGVAQITAVDPGFETPHFLDGARGAFEIIVGAFAK